MTLTRKHPQRGTREGEIDKETPTETTREGEIDKETPTETNERGVRWTRKHPQRQKGRRRK